MTDILPDLATPVRLHPLTYLDEGDEVTIGRADIDSYGLFPPDGAALVRRLEQGDPPEEAARWYQSEYGEAVDMAELLEVLDEMQFLLADGETSAVAVPVRWQRLARVVFSRPAAAALAAVVGCAGVAMLRHPRLFPRYQNLFFTHRSLTVLMIGMVLGQVPLMLAHEAAHALAGRRLGLNSKLSIGRRLYYVVFETSLDGLVGVPRRKRYLPMLAGILLDVAALSTLTLGADLLVGHPGVPGLVGRILLAMAFGVAIRIAWQSYFFLRTDIYFLVSTVLGCNDLQTVSRQVLRHRVSRVLHRPRPEVDPETWTPRDRAVARWYSWLVVLGYGFLLASVPLYMAPTAIRLTRLSLHELVTAPSPERVIDVIVFLLLNFSDFLIAGVIALLAYRRASSARASSKGRIL